MSSPLKGIDSFFEVLAIVSDPTKFKAKIEELQTEAKKYQDVVEAVVKLSEVNDYIKTIKERDISSKLALDKANADATAILAKASEDAVALGAKAKEAMKKAKEFEQAVAAREAVIATAERTISARTDAIAKANADLAQRQAMQADVEQSLADRKAKLMAAMG